MIAAEQSPLALLGQHDPDGLVAFGGSNSAAASDQLPNSGDRSAAQLLDDAARVAEALPEPSENSHVLLSLDRDRYAMAAAFLGTLRKGHAVALAPNSRGDSILAVRDRPEVVAFIHDTEANSPIRMEDLLERARPADPVPAPLAPEQEVIATVFTSGTTGLMKPLRKGTRELFGEAHRLGCSGPVHVRQQIHGELEFGAGAERAGMQECLAVGIEDGTRLFDRTIFAANE